MEVPGTLSPEQGRWFGAERVIPEGSNTILELKVADQAELYGRLRRIHDLNLQLISLQRLDHPDSDG